MVPRAYGLFLAALACAASFGCLPPKPAKTVQVTKARVWKDVPPEQVFTAILRREVAQGNIILNQSKEDGIINTDWNEYVQRGGRTATRMRSRASYVMTKIEGGTQLRMNLKLQVHQQGGWTEIDEEDQLETFALWYKGNFEEVSRNLGKPHEGGTDAEKSNP